MKNIENLVDDDVKKSYMMRLCQFYLAQNQNFNFSEERATIEDILDYFEFDHSLMNQI